MSDPPPRPPSGPGVVFLALAMAVSLGAVFYSVTITATADPTTRPYAAAIAAAAAAVLILFGWVDVNRAAKGLFSSALEILPRLHRWGVARPGRAWALGWVLLIVAAGSIWVGPMGISTQSAACGDADEIAFVGDRVARECTASLSRTAWLAPHERFTEPTIACVKGGNRWPGSRVGPGNWACGVRPQDPDFIVNGIAPPRLDPQTVEGARTLTGLERLRTALSDGTLPDRKVRDRLLFATWNLRDFGDTRFGFGPRMPESYAYIAEIIAHFDIVAIQELRDRAALTRLMDLLGPDYRAEFSFEAPGPGGNGERLGFIYDSRKVRFGDISTTIVFDNAGIEGSRSGQPSRPPFLAEFVVNDRRFFAMVAHAYFGQASGERFERRLQELRIMTSGLDRMLARNFPEVPALLAGDLNVSRADGPEMRALLDNGFETDPRLGAMATDMRGLRPYDQILIRSHTAALMPFGQSGVFRPFDHVFRDEDADSYLIDMRRLVDPGRLEGKDPVEVFARMFRSFQISDHALKWAEFRIGW